MGLCLVQQDLSIWALVSYTGDSGFAMNLLDFPNLRQCEGKGFKSWSIELRFLASRL